MRIAKNDMRQSHVPPLLTGQGPPPPHTKHLSLAVTKNTQHIGISDIIWSMKDMKLYMVCRTILITFSIISSTVIKTLTNICTPHITVWRTACTVRHMVYVVSGNSDIQFSLVLTKKSKESFQFEDLHKITLRI